MMIARHVLWLGMVVTPLVTPLAFFLAYALYSFAMGYNRPGMSWPGSLLFIYLFGLPTGSLAMFVLGWPWVTVLVRRNKLAASYVCGGSCIIGAIVFVPLAMLISDQSFELNTLIQQTGVGLFIGLLSGLIFCAIVRIPARLRG
jgi:hypothetical protein